MTHCLVSGHTKSCGCFEQESRGKSTTTHGQSRTPEYRTWHAIKRRCYDPRNPEYLLYGGRGISVCERWLNSFDAFFADMGNRPSSEHSIDRINNDGNYQPSNCRWADKITQMQNMSSNVNITYNGKTQCLAAWARELGIARKAIELRFKRGWSVERAFNEPLRRRA